MSTATVSRTARDLSPATLATEAARLVRLAQAQHCTDSTADHAAQRRTLREARNTVSDLRDAVRVSAFNEKHRYLAGIAGNAMHEAAIDRQMRPFWLTFAVVALDEIAGGVPVGSVQGRRAS